MPRVAYAYWPSLADLVAAIHNAWTGTLLAAGNGPLYMLAWDETQPWEENGVLFHQVTPPGYIGCYPIGRVFGALGELRWQTRGDQVHALLLTDADTPSLPAGFTGTLSIPDPGTVECYRLWGRRDHTVQGARVQQEGRIPHDLSYPGGSAPGAQSYMWLVTRRYLGDRGEVMFTRYVDLQPGEESLPASQ